MVRTITIAAIILATMIFSFAAITHAADVTLAWDANTEAVDGYRIFHRTADGNYDYDNPSWQGAETSGAVVNLTEGTQYAFVVRAYRGELESADSMEVVYTIPFPSETIVYPSQPRQIIIQFE